MDYFIYKVKEKIKKYFKNLYKDNIYNELYDILQPTYEDKLYKFIIVLIIISVMFFMYTLFIY